MFHFKKLTTWERENESERKKEPEIPRHRCQSTRSRLRSLNENRAAVGPEKPIINRRVHKVSEMSVVSDEYLNQITRANCIYNRTISTDTQRSKKEVQFDFSLKSFNEDNENAFIV